MADWQKIKTEYITTQTSYRKLAEKYGISYVQIGNVGKQEGWVELRKQHLDRTLTKTLSKDAQKKADRIARIHDVTDKLLDKVEQAITELDIQLAKTVHREKVIEYDNSQRPDKPTKEIIDENEEILEVSSIIDRQGLKQIASALRDIKEVHMLRSELDLAEQEARIAKLRKDAEGQKEAGDKQIIVTIGGGEDAWSK